MLDLFSDSVFFLLMTPSIISIGSLLFVMWKMGKEQQSECSVKQMSTTEFMNQLKEQMRRREILVRLGNTVYSIVDSSDEEEDSEGEQTEDSCCEEETNQPCNEEHNSEEEDHTAEKLNSEEEESGFIKTDPLPTNPFVATIKTK